MLDRAIRLFFSSLVPTSLHLHFSRTDLAPRNREKWLFISASPAVPDDRFPADFTAGTHARLAFFSSRHGAGSLTGSSMRWWNSRCLGPLRGNLRVKPGSISSNETGSMSEKRSWLCRRSRWNEVKRSLTDAFCRRGRMHAFRLEIYALGSIINYCFCTSTRFT